MPLWVRSAARPFSSEHEHRPRIRFANCLERDIMTSSETGLLAFIQLLGGLLQGLAGGSSN